MAVLIARGYHGVGKVPEGLDESLKSGIVDTLGYEKGGFGEAKVGFMAN